MKVLVLTNLEYHKFIYKESYKKYMTNNLDGNIWIYTHKVDTFPKNYDIGISFMYTYKVPAKEVNIHKWYNFHPAPLPAYKGRNLCYHAIMNGEKEFGASLHYMDENFDTGAIIDVWHFPIHDWMTAGDVSKDAIETSKAMFEEYFPQILEDFPFATIPNVGGIYYKKGSIKDFIDINYETVETLERKIRAISAGNFYPKIDVGGKIYKIVKEE